MSGHERGIVLSEWQTLDPTNCDALQGFFLDESQATSTTIQTLHDSRLIRLTELRHGLRVQAFSHVGRLKVGNLSITVLPKLPGTSMLNLLRYAYGFRNLRLLSNSPQFMEPCGFEDLLVAQLNVEAQELISRGLRRSYVPRDERLSSPRGRIDVGRLARDGGLLTATLPCRHYPRIENTKLNQVLRAGLELAGSMASGLMLRRESRRLALLMEESVSSVQLNAARLAEAERSLSRLTESYAPALSIIRLLFNSQGVTLEDRSQADRLPGFLFDMNAFFQHLISRFLRDNLPGYEVVDEQGLKQMMRYDPDYNPQRRPSPTPRPDYAVKQNGRVLTLLDAKYRDLWQRSLPREMLYQLVVYAISQPQRPIASILYPTAERQAKESRINIQNPVRGTKLGQVCLRPVSLQRIEELVSSDTRQVKELRTPEARRLAFGAAAATADVADAWMFDLRGKVDFV